MTTKKLVYSAVFVALGILYPMIFHALGLAGQVFLPMHTPVFLGALTLGPIPGLLIGITTPLLSGLLTGMLPMVPMAPIMIFELGAYGFFAGYLSEKYKKNIFVSLIVSMLIGRLVAGIVAFAVYRIFNMEAISVFGFISASFVKGIPGIIITLVLVPLLYKWMPVNIKNS